MTPANLIRLYRKPRRRTNLVPYPVVMILLTAGALFAQEMPTRTIRDLSLHELRATLKGYPGDWRPDTDREKGRSEPLREKVIPAGAVRIKLPAPDAATIGTVSLSDALKQRRSRRSFTGEALTSGDLGFLLWSTQGVTSNTEKEGDRSLRTAPSAGGRYPLETYVLALNVDGIPRGIHRYLPDSHELVTVREDENLPREMITICYGNTFVGDAAAIVVWAAVPERTEWKYGYLSPRMIAMEAGHACQNLYLACEAVGAGVCAMLSYDQVRLDALLGVDGENEFAIYLAVVGKVVR